MSVESITTEEIREWFEMPQTRSVIRKLKDHRSELISRYDGVAREDRLVFLDQMDGFGSAIGLIESLKVK